MSIKKVFKCRIPSCKYLFSNGKEANFIGGKYLTDLDIEISQLENEIKSGHPHIYVDAAEKEVDTEQMDPIEQIKKKAIAEYLAAQKAALDPNNDRGSTEAGKLQGIANSTTIAPLVDGSDKTEGLDPSTSSLAHLTAKVKAAAVDLSKTK